MQRRRALDNHFVIELLVQLPGRQARRVEARGSILAFFEDHRRHQSGVGGHAAEAAGLSEIVRHQLFYMGCRCRVFIEQVLFIRCVHQRR